MTPDTLQQPAVRALIQQTAEVLGAPLDDAAIEYKIPDEMMRSLREDVFVFSGFKTYHQLKEASELLLDEQGRVKSFNKFYQDVSAIREKYNRNWLHAEYNFAVSSSQMAAKWAEQSADADICDLTYSTAGDDKVRPDHAALDGVTLPVEDPFWSYAYPPNGWNCRCNVIRSLKGTRPLSDSERCQETFMQTTEGREEIFRYNPGRDEVLFPPHHPYYGKRGYKHCLNPHLATSLGDGEECQIHSKLKQNIEEDTTRKEERKKQFEKLKNDPKYTDVDFNPNNGGLKATHIDHNFDNKKGWYERRIQSIGFEEGHAVVLEAEPGNTFKHKHSEGTWNGNVMEIAGAEIGSSANIRNALKHCASKPNVKVAVVFFPDSNALSVSNIEKGIARYNGLKGTSQWKLFDEILFISNDGKIIQKKPEL